MKLNTRSSCRSLAIYSLNTARLPQFLYVTGLDSKANKTVPGSVTQPCSIRLQRPSAPPRWGRFYSDLWSAKFRNLRQWHTFGLLKHTGKKKSSLPQPSIASKSRSGKNKVEISITSISLLLYRAQEQNKLKLSHISLGFPLWATFQVPHENHLLLHHHFIKIKHPPSKPVTVHRPYLITHFPLLGSSPDKQLGSYDGKRMFVSLFLKDICIQDS